MQVDAATSLADLAVHDDNAARLQVTNVIGRLEEAIEQLMKSGGAYERMSAATYRLYANMAVTWPTEEMAALLVPQLPKLVEVWTSDNYVMRVRALLSCSTRTAAMSCLMWPCGCATGLKQLQYVRVCQHMASVLAARTLLIAPDAGANLW